MLEKAVFGGGCFWCYEAIFARLKGVNSSVSGYAGGATENPDYERVSGGRTGHAEVVQVEFDPSVISYEILLDIFFHIHDPTQVDGQGADRGTQYRSIILYTNEAQREAATKMIAELNASEAFRGEHGGELIATAVQPLDQFYTAEAYHQKYYESNPDQPYCSLVIQPKIAKFLAKYKALTK
ncbi:peptide-methionine (S)-S-oxide reductase MsrA [Candidatus Gracilibacteria bacterium]|nr:peptide-methionine (S)-S-oxide reductase MsrA [Candidatus Gracilibacteria bacterium]